MVPPVKVVATATAVNWKESRERVGGTAWTGFRRLTDDLQNRPHKAA